MPENGKLRDCLQEVVVRRFEVGDKVMFRLHDGSGYAVVVADEGGYEVSLAGTVASVTDSMLGSAKTVHVLTCGDPEGIKKKRSIEWEPLDKLPELSSPPERVYYCNCPLMQFSHTIYHRWERMLASGQADVLWKMVGNDKKPMKWPDRWIGGLCQRCHSAIMVRRSK